MIYGIYASIAGMRAADKRLANAAGNIANSNTDGYKRTEATVVEDKVELPEVNIVRDPAAGAIIEESDGVQRETSNVDLSWEMPEMMIAKRAYQANVQTIKAQDEALQSVLDIVA